MEEEDGTESNEVEEENVGALVVESLAEVTSSVVLKMYEGDLNFILETLDVLEGEGKITCIYWNDDVMAKRFKVNRERNKGEK